jgi:hypothetical protein
MWSEFYEALDTQNRVPVLECKHCFDFVKHPLLVGKNAQNRGKTGVTTGMIRHLEGCKPYLRSKGKDSGIMDKFLTHNGAKKKVLVTQNEIMDRVLKFFISGNVAFNQADNPYFRDLIALIKCDNDINVKVNRSNVTTRLHNSAADAKSDLMATLMQNESKISLALDCWTSRNQIAFLGMLLYHPFWHRFAQLAILCVLQMLTVIRGYSTLGRQ